VEELFTKVQNYYPKSDEIDFSFSIKKTGLTRIILGSDGYTLVTLGGPSPLSSLLPRYGFFAAEETCPILAA
jgi:hypothetical protein